MSRVEQLPRRIQTMPGPELALRLRSWKSESVGHDGENAFQREAPYRQVVGAFEFRFPHMERLRNDVRKVCD